MSVNVSAWRAALAQSWLPEIERELTDNILSFWMLHAPDEEHGGFRGEIRPDLTVVRGAPKSLVLNARMLWTFASAYRVCGDPAYLRMAERAWEELTARFADERHGGLYWMLDGEGRPLAEKKQVYGQAFAIYAFAEYHRATGQEEALKRAIELFRLLERYGYDPVHGGYVEALARDWSPTDDLSLSGKDLNEKKSMNTHLHVLEAYTNLLRVWPSDELRDKLRELMEVTLAHIVDANTGHFRLFFDEAWRVKSDDISFGHDIEGSWLLTEAAETLGDRELMERVRPVAIRMAEATLCEGVDVDGGIRNEANPQGLTDPGKDWWPQAEAVVGFFNAFELTGDIRFLDASRNAWTFIQRFLVDREHGEWFWGVHPDGTPDRQKPKVGAWKCPYHNARACFEMKERLTREARFGG